MAISGGGRGELNSEINVTPMVDVMLVLLVIFMVTAPLLNTGVEVDLPETNTQPVKDPKGKPTLSITKQYELFIGGQKLEWAGLRESLARMPSIKELQIEADASLPYAVVVTAMAVAQEAGVGKLQLLSDPGAQLDLRALDGGQMKAGAPTAGPLPAAPTPAASPAIQPEPQPGGAR